MLDLLAITPLLVKAAIMGLVEGLTEFLPISSTGHLILVGSLLGLHDDKAKLFDVAIQTGAMLAVVWYYRQRILGTVAGIASERQAQRFALNLLIAFLPAALLGLAFGKVIKQHLFAPVPVAVAFVVGGLVILWVERAQGRHRIEPRIREVDALGALDALKLGCAQAFALAPGTSRSGATIIGGMLFGLSRPVATEFSFFLAMPTLLAAGAYDTWKYRHLLSMHDLPLFAVGLTASFVSALACVRWLIRYVSGHTFVPFAWYRIVFGAVVLITAWTGLVDWAP
jgi:undecaprenyl-diphosphatase